MTKVKIITDSCSDLSGELLEKYDIDYVKMRTVCDGVESEASLRWENRTPGEFYGLMREGKRITTTQVPPQEFQRVFGEYLAQGYDIVYIACCSKQSGSVNTGAVVARQLLSEYEGRAVHCIDSLNACMGEGLLAIRAAELRDEGLSAGEIAESIKAVRKNVNEYVAVHSLDALRRAGRVKASAAFFGNLLGVKPIIISDKNGVQTPIKKVKGRRTSLDEIVALTKASIREPEKQTVYISHADCNEAELAYVKEAILREIPCKDVYVNYIGPIIGASIGPDAIAILCFGEEVTFEG